MENTENLQNWVDKLAAFNSNVTQNDIMQWAASVPLIPLDQYKTIPLFLYGDATLDKAIVDIIQHPESSEPAVNEIYGIVSKTYKMNPVEDDSKILTPETISDLPKSNNRPGDWNAMIADNPPSRELYKEPGRVPQNTVNRQRIGDYITQDKYESAHRVAAQDNSQNAVHFNRVDKPVIDALNEEPLLWKHGFKAVSYDDTHVLISNGSLDYTVEIKPYQQSGAFYVESNQGYSYPCASVQEFINNVVSKEAPEMQFYFSKAKNFADEAFDESESVIEPTEIEPSESTELPTKEPKDDIVTSMELTLAQLTNIMALFQNDMLYMHHHSVGDDFDAVHRITQDLYEKAGENVDKLAEMAIRVGEQVGNLSDAQAIASTLYDTITEGDVDIDRMESELNRKGGILLGALRRCRKYSSDIMSDIDALISDWATEIEYKNAARSKNFAAHVAEAEPIPQTQVAAQVAEIATAVVDDLTAKYSEVLDKLDVLTNQYESLCQIKEDKEKIINELQSQLTGSETEDANIQDACATLGKEVASLSEQIDELQPQIKQLLDSQKEFTDVMSCTNRQQYLKELTDLIPQVAPAAAPKNFQDDSNRGRNLDRGEDFGSKSEEEAVKKWFKSKMGDSESPEQKARKKAEEDMINLRPEYQHLTFIKEAVKGSQRRQLEEMFKEYDRAKEDEEREHQRAQQLLVDDKYLDQEAALNKRRQQLQYEAQMENIDQDTGYAIARQRILDKENNLKQFRKTASDGVIDIIVKELPNEKLISTYDKIIGNNLMKNHQALDGAAYALLGTTLRNKDTIGNIAKAAAGMLFSNSSDIDRLTNRVTERLLRLGFSYKQLEPVISGKMFSRIPRECLDADSMTREALIHLTGSVSKGKKLFSRAIARKNFSNENYELVDMHDMPARYKYNMANPRYDFTENCWTAGDEHGVERTP